MATRKSNNRNARNLAPNERDALMDESPALPARTDTGAVQTTGLKVKRDRLMADLAGVVDATHVGGSLPLIKFENEGESVIAKFLGRNDPAEGDDREFSMLTFDVISPAKLKATRSVDASIIGRAQMVESTAIAEFFDTAAPGSLVILTYVGETPTRRGQSNLKLITVESFKVRV